MRRTVLCLALAVSGIGAWQGVSTPAGGGPIAASAGPAARGNVPGVAGRVKGGIDLTDEGDPYTDSFGHGTFVAGILAGDGNASHGANRGVAPGAYLVPVKIAGASGATDVSHVLAAIQWVVSFHDKYGIRVMNLS